MPTRSSPCTTGTPEMLCLRVSSRTRRMVVSGVTVMGSLMTPASYFLTRLTCSACSWADIFLWMMPMPPSCARAMARRASVTVSIAADTSGMLSDISRVSRVLSSTSRGSTVEWARTNSTSSKVSASSTTRSMGGRQPKKKKTKMACHYMASVYSGKPRRLAPSAPPYSEDCATIRRMDKNLEAPPALAPRRDVYSVSRLNREVRALLDRGFALLWIEGELSNLSRPSSGHFYFSLIDRDSQVRCAMFRMRNQFIGFTPADGMQVLARARATLYEPRGDYQLVVEHMEEAGDGLLRRAFEELKKRQAAEGLFNPAHKKPLPPPG